MTLIPIQAPTRLAANAPTRRSGTSIFQVPTEAETTAASQVGHAAATASLAGLLSLQEVEPPHVRDRRARQHGQALLAELSRLQLALLGSPPEPGLLRRLADLAIAAPLAADPELQDALAGLVLRAKVELAHLDVANATPA